MSAQIRHLSPSFYPALATGKPGNFHAQALFARGSPARKNLRQILQERGIEPSLPEAVELVLELQEKGGVSCIYHCLNQEDIERIMRHSCTMIASDGTVQPFGEGMPHPRNYGTFPRVPGLYVRKLGILSLEEAVRKMTSLPAQRAGLLDRGLLRPGAAADIVIFEPERIIDRATFQAPHQYPEGIETVIVNGEIVLEKGELTSRRPGKVLRRAAQRVKTESKGWKAMLWPATTRKK